MDCHCGEKAFTYTRILSRDGKKYTCLVGRCNKSIEETSKKKKKCDFKEEKVLEVDELFIEKVKVQPFLVCKKYVATREDHIRDLLNAISTIKNCQCAEYPFDKYTNRILYLSKKLNIPPYIQEKHTIEDYYKIADHYLNNPIPVPNPKPIKKYSLTNDFLESIKTPSSPELHNHFKKLLTTEKTISKVKLTRRTKQNVVLSIVGEFKTGGINDEDLVQEDELDIEEFDTDEEQDDFNEDYRSD